MRRVGLKLADKKWLRKLGERIDDLVKNKGYKSQYDFWINKVGDDISKGTLYAIVSGQYDAKVTSLRAIAKGLGVSLKDLLDF